MIPTFAPFAAFARNHPENIYSPKNLNIFKQPPFSAKVKHHKSPANRAKIGGRVHFDFPKENRVKCTVRLEPDSFSGRMAHADETRAWEFEGGTRQPGVRIPSPG